MMASPTIVDNVVIVNPIEGNEIINGMNDVLLSIILAAKPKTSDLNTT
jgi:hypothetical protein